MEIVRDDLLSCFVEQKIDVLVFNPPYVPSEKEELGRDDLYAAWAGGDTGVDTLEVLIPRLPVFLKFIDMLEFIGRGRMFLCGSFARK